MPRVPPFDRPATHDDLRKVPDTHVAEIVDGELHVTPRPDHRHARTGSSMGMAIGGPYDHGRGGPGGWWVVDEPELRLGRDVLVPDLAAWRRERMPHLPQAAFFPLAPDWVCEILSPSTASFDRVMKLAAYAREGVRHAWLIDPEARMLELLRLDKGHWTVLGTYYGDDVVRAEPFAEIDLELASLCAE